MDTNDRIRWIFRMMWVVILLLAALIWCCMCWRAIPREEAETETVSRPDCQQDSVFTVDLLDESAAVNRVRLDTMVLIGEIANIPEFHDCQRFIRVKPAGEGSPADQYGPLVAVWAAHNLDSFPLLGTPLARPWTVPTGVPVAIINDFDLEEYSPLGIKPGFNCLYLMQSPNTPEEWFAKMEWIQDRPSACEKDKPWANIAGSELAVFPASLPSILGPEDIPPVARWAWDPSGGKQYLGLRCGDQWCDITDGSVKPSSGSLVAAVSTASLQTAFAPMPASVGIAPATAAEVTRLLSIRGWYDEQQLALRDPVTKELVPSGITGVAFPDPVLDRLSKRSAASSTGFPLGGTWIPSAYIFVDGDYAGKVHLYMGWNRISLCQGSATACGIPSIPSTCSSVDTSWGMILPEPALGRVAQYHCVKQMHHSPDIPAGTVRWRWSELDETQWIRCPTTGCCTVN